MNTALCIREATPAEVTHWDDLVTRFSNHRIFHKQAWLQFLEASEGLKPLYLVFEKDKDLVGCLPGLLFSKCGFRVFGSPFPGWQTHSMGPVFELGRTCTHEIFSQLIPFLEAVHHVHHIEVACTDLDANDMERLGFRGTPQPTYRAPLTPGDEEKTMRHMEKSVRHSVKRALKLGLTVELDPGEDFVDDIYRQSKDVFIRGGAAIPYPKKRVLEWFRRGTASGNLRCVSVLLPDKQTRIATGMFLLDGKEICLWIWATQFEYRWYSPTELMTWTMMQKAMEAGCRTFDLAGRGKFKEKFGAELDTRVWRWLRSRYAWLARARDFAEKSYRWQQSVRGRLSRLTRRATAKPAAAASQPL